MQTQGLEKIGRTVHQALNAWRVANGGLKMADWDDLDAERKASTIASVRYVIDNPETSAEAQHDQWTAQKQAAGWSYGEVRNDARKIHPLLRPYKTLPEFEKRKDALLNAIVNALTLEVS